MEQLQPQIHEQEGDEKAEIIDRPRETLAASGNRALKRKLRETCLAIEEAVFKGEKTADEGKASLEEMNQLCQELAGMDTETLKQDVLLDEIEMLIPEEATHPAMVRIATTLAGLDTPRAWELREKILTLYPDIFNSVVDGCAGIDSPRAWELRDQALSEVKNNGLGSNFRFFKGLNSEKAWDSREKLMDLDEGNAHYVVEHLVGLDTPEAWEMRDKFAEQQPNLTLMGLGGIDTPRAWKMRDDLMANGAHEVCLVQSIIGLESERAWEVRENYWKKPRKNFLQLSRSLAGVDSDRAWEMREWMFDNAIWKEMAESLAGLNSYRAREMRERLLSKYIFSEIVAGGVNGDADTGIAWRAVKGFLPHQIEQKNQKTEE